MNRSKPNGTYFGDDFISRPGICFRHRIKNPLYNVKLKYSVYQFLLLRLDDKSGSKILTGFEDSSKSYRLTRRSSTKVVRYFRIIFRFRFLAVINKATGLGWYQWTFHKWIILNVRMHSKKLAYHERNEGSKRMTSDVVNTSMGYSNAAFKYSWLLAVHAIRIVLSCL